MKTNKQPARYCLLLLFACIISMQAFAQAPITNFDKDGNQVTRFSTVGDAIDAHDGEIAFFDNIYYLYGTSYDCGFEWGNKDAPFCGFKVYSSKDLVNWTDKGFLFDAQTSVWQKRCNGNTYGCFRPHVIFNPKTQLYVLWINVYDNVSGYRVFTSKTPVGPFTETAEPVLAVNGSAPAGGLNNGDHDTFVDDDGTAYLAYTDWRTKGTIVIEKLSADYLTGTGEHVKAVTPGQTEAPGLFKRNGLYYVVYSDPNCGYCSGTGTAYRTASSPLGTWSEGRKISDNSCGGQPSFVSTIKLKQGTVFLYGSDLWNNAAKNEALANYYWAPLSFAPDGSILPMTCEQSFKISGNQKQPFIKVKDAQGFRLSCDISKDKPRIQSFYADATGSLSSVSFNTFKTGYPDADLQAEIYKANAKGEPVGGVLASQVFPAAKIGWSARNEVFHPKISVKKGLKYCLVLRSASVTGCYGVAHQQAKGTAIKLSVRIKK